MPRLLLLLPAVVAPHNILCSPIAISEIQSKIERGLEVLHSLLPYYRRRQRHRDRVEQCQGAEGLLGSSTAVIG
jgi:hypothetical protein